MTTSSNGPAATHASDSLYQMADEFLLIYLQASHWTLFTSRLFVMGHTLELYAKAVLASSGQGGYFGHEVPDLLARIDPALCLAPAEVARAEQLYAPDVINFDLGLALGHEEMLELYQAQYFLMDLKYYLDRQQQPIYPARSSLTPINARFVELARDLRSRVPHMAKPGPANFMHSNAPLAPAARAALLRVLDPE